MKNVTVILVSYNSAGVIAKALASVHGHIAVQDIIVVDNASADDTREVIKREFPTVTLIENPVNDGFGRANNLALAQVNSPYALLLNPDAVLRSDALEHLLAAAASYPDAAILAPMLAGSDGALHHSHKRNLFAREQSRDHYITPQGDCCAEFLSGAVWLLNMHYIKEIGFFDPAIFLYYEDDDVCMRARKNGNSLVLVHAAKAIHLMGASSGKHSFKAERFKQMHMTWSRLYMEKKYHGETSALALATHLRWKCLGWAVYFTLTGNNFKKNRYRGRLAGIKSFRSPAIKP